MFHQLRYPAAAVVFCSSVLGFNQELAEAQDAETKPGIKSDGPIAAKEKHRFELPGLVDGLAFSPDGKLLAAGDTKGSLIVWDMPSGKENKRIDFGKSKVRRVVFTPDGLHLAVSLEGKAMKLWKVETWHEDISLSGGGSFHPDGKQRVCVSKGMVQIRDAKKDELIREFRASPNAFGITWTALSKDGKMLALAYPVQKTIKIWLIESGQQKSEMKGHDNPVRALCFSPSGKTIASASEDNTVRIWKTEDGEMTNIIKLGPNSELLGANSVLFSPDGKWLAIGTPSQISIRDATTGKEVLTLKTEPGGSRKLAFNPKGTLLASTGGQFVQVWELSEQRAAPPEKGPGEKQPKE